MSGWGHLPGRRLWARRGWGGVAAMAAACALAVAGSLVPLGDDGTDAAAPRTPAVPVTQAGYASAQDTCTDPEASLNPLSGPTDGPAVQAIVNRKRLVVGVDQNSYLWGFRNPATGRLDGFDIDIVRAIAQDILGDADKVQYLTVPTNKREERIQDGTVDMVVRTMTINCDRLGKVAFSTAYFEAGQQILAPRNSPITGYDASLKGRTVCTASTSTGDTKLTEADPSTGKSDAQRFGVKEVLKVPNQLDCLVRLQLGLADAVLTDNALGAGQAAQDPSVELKGRPVTLEPYGVAMNLGSPDLVRRVNQVLDDYRAGGSGSAWMTSYHDWLADDLEGISGPPEPKYQRTPTPG